MIKAVEDKIEHSSASAHTVLAPDSVFSNTRNMRYSAFDVADQYPDAGGSQDLIKCVNNLSERTGTRGPAVPSFEVVGDPGQNQTIRCVLRQDVHLPTSPSGSYTCGPYVYISASQADVAGAVTGAKLGTPIATASDILQLATQFATLDSRPTHWDWEKITSAVPPIFQLGNPYVLPDFVFTIIPPLVDYNRVAFWTRAWLLYHSLLQLEVLRNVELPYKETCTLRKDEDLVTVHIWPYKNIQDRALIEKRSQLLLLAMEYNWVVAIGNEITWDMVAVLRAGASEAPFLTITYTDRVVRPFHGETQRPIASLVSVTGRHRHQKLIIISDRLYQEVINWQSPPVVVDDFQVDTLNPYAAKRYPASAQLAHSAIVKATTLMHDRCASVDGMYVATLLSYVNPVKAPFMTLDECDVIRNNCQEPSRSYVFNPPMQAPQVVQPATQPVGRPKGRKPKTAAGRGRRKASAATATAAAGPCTRARSKRTLTPNMPDLLNDPSLPEPSGLATNTQSSVNDGENKLLDDTPSLEPSEAKSRKATLPRSRSSRQDCPPPCSAEYDSGEEYCIDDPEEHRNFVVVLYMNGFHNASPIELPIDIMRPPLALLFSQPTDSSAYDLLAHPDWFQIIRMTASDMLRMSASLVCLFATARAETMYSLCIRWLDVYVGSLTNGSHQDLRRDYLDGSMQVASTLMFEGGSLGNIEMPSGLTNSHFSALVRSVGLIVPAGLYANVRYAAHLCGSQLERILLTHGRLLHRSVFGPDLVLPYASALASNNPYALVSDRYAARSFVEYPRLLTSEGYFSTMTRTLLGKNSLFVADQDRIGFMNGLVSQTLTRDVKFDIYHKSILDSCNIGATLQRRHVEPRMYRDIRGHMTTYVHPGFFQTFEAKAGIYRFFQFYFSRADTPEWMADPNSGFFLDRGMGLSTRLNDLCLPILSLPQPPNITCSSGIPLKKRRMIPAPDTIVTNDGQSTLLGSTNSLSLNSDM